MPRKTPTVTTAALRRLPSVDELLHHERLRRLAAEIGRGTVLEAARQALEKLRAEIRAGLGDSALATHLQHLPQEVEGEARELLALSLRPVINATGVVLHTNLGRAPLGAEAARRVFDIAT